MLGYSEQELYGQTIRQLMHPEDVDHEPLNITSLREEHEVIGRQFVKRYRRKDGAVIWTAATMSVVRDTYKKPKYVIGIVEDITPHKHLAVESSEAARFGRSIIDALSRHTRMIDAWPEGQIQDADRPSAASEDLQLTSRQREILRKIAQGDSTKEIAHSLGISPKTVDAHRMQIMERLDIRNVPGLVRYAIRTGLAKLE
jgi:PAS domain S-box-containing protein